MSLACLVPTPSRGACCHSPGVELGSGGVASRRFPCRAQHAVAMRSMPPNQQQRLLLSDSCRGLTDRSRSGKSGSCSAAAPLPRLPRRSHDIRAIGRPSAARHLRHSGLMPVHILQAGRQVLCADGSHSSWRGQEDMSNSSQQSQRQIITPRISARRYTLNAGTDRTNYRLAMLRC